MEEELLVLSDTDKENIKFALLLTIQSLNKSSSKQLRIMKINKFQAVNEYENLLKRFYDWGKK